MTTQNGIKRYSPSDRANHVLVAVLFILAALSGLALFHPSMFFLTAVLGGGELSRVLHPFVGVASFVFILGMFLRFWHHNLVDKNDQQWMCQMGDVLNGREEKLPEVGRYNAGQKMFFWLMAIALVVLLLTGLTFWRPYFVDYFSLDVRRAAVLIHALAAWIIILGLIVHIYAAIWVKGALGAMRTGYVSKAWARRHHPAWYREVTGGNK